MEGTRVKTGPGVLRFMDWGGGKKEVKLHVGESRVGGEADKAGASKLKGKD